MQTVTSTDGTRIAYERRGDGPPLVLLHGGSAHRYWEPLVPRFADDHAVVLPDRRGHGDSGDRDEYGIEREVEDARAVMGAVDGDPILFGHSFGGLQAIEAARDASVAGVVAYEPAYLADEYRAEADLAARVRERLDEEGPREATKCHLREVLYGGDPEDFERWLDEWPRWPDGRGWPDRVGTAENAIRMDRALERHPLPDELDVDAPVLLLAGTESPTHLRESVRAVREALPDGRLVEFVGLGHDGPTEAPDRVADEVREFLASAATDA